MKYSKIEAKSSTLLNLGLGLIFIIVSISVVILVNRAMRQQALVEAKAKARILIDRNLATHTYFSHILKPNVFAWSEPFLEDDHFDPSWMSSTFAVREIDQFFKELSPTSYYIKDAAVNARSPENEADAYEKAFLEELRSNPSLGAQSAIHEINGEPYFVTLSPGEVLEKSCMRCHSDPNAAPADLVEYYGLERSFHRETDQGSVISVISVRIPLADAYKQADQFSIKLSALLLLLLAGLFAAQLWLQKRLVFSPLQSIRNKTHEISADPERLGEEIPLPFSTDLAHLTMGFNRMSVKLRQSRDELEKQVLDRTAALTKTNTILEHEINERKQAQGALQRNMEHLEEQVEERTKALRDAQEKMVRQEKLAVLGHLAGGVGHELRNPLGIISNAVYYLRHIQPEASDRVREYLGIIEAETRNADKIITDLLDFSRNKSVESAPASIQDLLADTLERFPVPDRIRVTLNLPKDLPPVVVDARQIIQTLGNLTLNACQAMEQGGELNINAQTTIAQDRTFIAIAIRDTGTGIPPGDMEKLFEPLFTTKPKGIGLGLAVSKKLVEANQGWIEVESQLGKGSTFTLYLPASGEAS